MTNVNPISFADDAASNAWSNAGLGEFDPESSLAGEVDADDDGVITEDEINTYESEKNQSTTTTTTTTTSTTPSTSSTYSVVNLAQAPENYDEMKADMNAALESFDEMNSFVNQIDQENSILISQIQALTGQTSSPTDPQDAASAAAEVASNVAQAGSLTDKAKANLTNLDQVTEDVEVTDDAVNKILEKVNTPEKSPLDKFLNGIGITGYGICASAVIAGIVGLASGAVIGIFAVGFALGLAAFIGKLIGGNSNNTQQQSEIKTLGESAEQKYDDVKTYIDNIDETVADTVTSAEKAEGITTTTTTDTTTTTSTTDSTTSTTASTDGTTPSGTTDDQKKKPDES